MRSNSDDLDLTPAPTMRKNFNISATTEWRWNNDSTLGFPKPIWIRSRKYYRSGELRAFQNARQSTSKQEVGGEAI